MTTRDPVMHVAPASSAHPGVLVVHEGARRLRWHTHGPGSWRLTGLWPAPAELEAVLLRIHRDEPVLIVLPSDDARVDVEKSEIAMRLDDVAQVDVGGEFVELTVPLLDWLPEPWRTRGLLFAEQADGALAGQPTALRPPLLVEQLDQACPLRFARRTSRAMTDQAFADAACQVFADRLSLGPVHSAASRLRSGSQAGALVRPLMSSPVGRSA